MRHRDESMKAGVRVAIIGLMIMALAGAAVAILTDPGLTGTGRNAPARLGPRSGSPHEVPPIPIPLVTGRFTDESGYQLASELTPAIEDRGSLEQARSVVRVRAKRGRSRLLGQFERLDALPGIRSDRDMRRVNLQAQIAMLFMYNGRFEEASGWLKRAGEENPGIPADLNANLVALRGIAAPGSPTTRRWSRT